MSRNIYRKVTVLSFFAGGGGSATGFHMADFQILMELDLSSNAIATLKENYPESLAMRVDITDTKVKWVLETLGMKRGELDILDASPSCKGFSLLSDRDFFNPQNLLTREVVRFAKGLHPKVVIMENVPAMAQGIMQPYFDQVINGLKKCGYKVAYKVLNAAHHGVAQNRKRLFIIAIRKDLNVTPTFPPESGTVTTVRDVLPDCIAFSMWHRRRSMMRSASNPAGTLVTGDCITIFDAMGERKPTMEELKKLSSFPDGYILPVSNANAMTIIGNCVPPLLMKSIAVHIWEICLKEQCTLVFPDGKWFIGHEGKRVISRTALDALDKPEFDPGLRDTEEEVPEAKIKSPEEIEQEEIEQEKIKQEKIKWAMYFKEVRERAKEYNKKLDKIG